MEKVIDDVLEEDVPVSKHAHAATTPSDAPTAPQLNSLRCLFEGADAANTVNGGMSGTVHVRVFGRACESVLGWKPDRTVIEGLTGKNGGIAYRSVQAIQGESEGRESSALSS